MINKPKIVLIFFISISVFASENFLGFKTLNVLNLATGSRCSGVLLKTKKGCQAVTNSHCVKDLSINEKNVVISQINKPLVNTEEEIEMFSKLFFVNLTDKRSHLVKAKPSSDLAEIYFDPAWAPEFCSGEEHLTIKGVGYYPHYSEVFPAGYSPSGGMCNQQTAMQCTSSQGNRDQRPFLYEDSRTKCFLSAGFQFDQGAVSAVFPIKIKDLVSGDRSVVCPKTDNLKSVTKLDVNFSSLPGLEYMYKVTGVNLSQGFSGGPLINFHEDWNRTSIVGIAASVYQFKWQSNYIRIKDVLEFLINYEDDFSDQFVVELSQRESRVVSDENSKNLEKIMKFLEDNRDLPNLEDHMIEETVNDSRRAFELLDTKRERLKIDSTIPDLRDSLINGSSSNSGGIGIGSDSSRRINIPTQKRVEGLANAFGNTDQEDVDDPFKDCKFDKSKTDPFFDTSPSITSCFDLTQTRYKHSGVLIGEDKDKIAYAYREGIKVKQITGYKDLKDLKRRRDFVESKILIRKVGELPSIEFRKSILSNFSGKLKPAYIGSNNILPQYDYLLSHATRYLSIEPSVNSLLNELIEKDIPYSKEDFQNNYFSFDIANGLNNSENGKIFFDIDETKFNIDFTNHDKKRYLLKLIPSYNEDYSKLSLKGSGVIKDQANLGRVLSKIDSLELICDLYSAQKLICHGPRLEIGLSQEAKGSRPEFRISFWDELLIKEEAFKKKKYKMNYAFGFLEKSLGRVTVTKAEGMRNSFRHTELKDFLKGNLALKFYPETTFDKASFKIHDKFNKRLNCAVEELSFQTFYYLEEVYHIVHDYNDNCRKRRVNGQIISEEGETVGLFIKDKFVSVAD